MRRIPNFLALLLLAFIVAACGTARVNQFNGLAAGGIKYADTVPAVLDLAFENAVKTDTLVLLENRDALSQDDRLKAIEKSNANLSQRLQILNDLKRHASLLRSYFVALRALAESDSESGIGDAASGLVDSMAKISKRVSTLKVGSLPVKDFLSQAVPIVVTQFKSAALNRELKERGKTIERELDLQQAALTAIAEAMREDFEAQYTALERDKIVLPFVKDGSLPGDWNQRRLDAFKRQVELSAVDAAATAAKNLRLSFISLAENRLDDGAIRLLLDDVERVTTLIESIRGKGK